MKETSLNPTPLPETAKRQFGFTFQEFYTLSCQNCGEPEPIAFNSERGLFLCVPCFCELGFLQHDE